MKKRTLLIIFLILLGTSLLVIFSYDYYKKLKEPISSPIKAIPDNSALIFEIKNSITKIAEELRFFAKKEQIRVIEKYIDLWNPLKFVTESDLKKILEERGDKNSRTKRPIQPKYGRE